MLLLTLMSCSDKSDAVYIPNISEGMADGIYMKYKLKLDTAYLNKDDFEIGIQLANLKGSADSVYIRINNGIKKSPKNCYIIYHWYNGYQDDFLNNIVKTDTVRFLETFKLCEQLDDIESYSEYWTRKTIEHQKRIAKRDPIDSTKLNYKLVTLLDKIRIDDQETRIEISKSRIEDYKHPLRIKQNRLDSINLTKVDSILENGFPTKDEVGYEGISTIWLVLHHQGELNVRLKYMSILEEAVENRNLGKGAFESYKMRNEHIKLGKQ